MTSSFIITLDHGSDTDLLGIAEDLKDALAHTSEYEITSVKPFAHPSLGLEPTSQSTLFPPIPPPL